MMIKLMIMMLLSMVIIGCKMTHPMAIENRHTTTITERLVDTNVRIHGDSLLSVYHYNVLDNTLAITPKYKFGSNLLNNIIDIDTLTKTIRITTIQRDTIVKLQYKNIFRTDTIYEKITQQITTNKLNGWQKIVQGFGYSFMGIIVAIILFTIIKIYLKYKPI